MANLAPVSAWIERIHQDHLVVEGLVEHDVHILLEEIEIEWSLVGKAHGGPVQAPIIGPEEIELFFVEGRCGVCIDDRVTRNANSERGAAGPGIDISGVRDG